MSSSKSKFAKKLYAIIAIAIIVIPFKRNEDILIKIWIIKTYMSIVIF